MNAPERLSDLHSDSLAREIAAQLQAESDAVIATAQAEAAALVAAAHRAARARMHAAVVDLRRDGARHLARANARIETEMRSQAQRRAAAAIDAALPLLRDAVAKRWLDPMSRRQWTDAVAKLAAARLRAGPWHVTHPADWPKDAQQAFAAGQAYTVFAPDPELTAGIVVESDGARLDATPAGLLADEVAVAAALLSEIEAGS